MRRRQPTGGAQPRSGPAGGDAPASPETPAPTGRGEERGGDAALKNPPPSTRALVRWRLPKTCGSGKGRARRRLQQAAQQPHTALQDPRTAGTALGRAEGGATAQPAPGALRCGAVRAAGGGVWRGCGPAPRVSCAAVCWGRGGGQADGAPHTGTRDLLLSTTSLLPPPARGCDTSDLPRALRHSACANGRGLTECRGLGLTAARGCGDWWGYRHVAALSNAFPPVPQNFLPEYCSVLTPGV